ncbi:MAG: SagB/ThcOx family dehydrogenase [Nitriliruptorales bacterium]|nr:SagB/ThcOx family dehydrogenase [Nitriliruptorales bacterium]
MPAEVARSFHERTSHTWRSVRAAGHDLDWSDRPLPFKLYPDLPLIELPVQLRESDWPALDALSGDGPPNTPLLDLQWLASLLFYTAGVTRRWARNGRDLHFRAASSAGALYPVETYVVCGELDDHLSAGIYHFEPLEFGLRRLRDGDHRRALAEAAVEPAVSSAPITVVLTGLPTRTTWKYRLRGYRHLWWDAGTMLANLLAQAQATSQPARLLTGFVDGEVSDLLGLDRERELPLVVVPVGTPGDDARGGAAAEGPRHASVPVRRAEVDHDLLAVHRVADLPTRRAVLDWRQSMQDLRVGPATVISHPPALAPFDTLEEVILRRGSTRRFAQSRVPTEALVWPVAVAAGSSPADFLLEGETLLSHHLLVHQVAGVQPGAYRWTPHGPELRRPGSFRGEATALCLEQQLGGEGAYTAFHLADLERILEKGGERAYRAVQLEGGIASGRLQLAAHTLGLGATALTFYDEDVARFFDTALEAATVTAVGTPAYDPRSGARPADSPPARLDDGSLRL